jgi:hypothetical protein
MRFPSEQALYGASVAEGRAAPYAALQPPMKIVAGCSRHSFNAWIIAAAS